MFLLLFFKSKYRRKVEKAKVLVFLVTFYSSFFINLVLSSKCSDVRCINGECINGTCVCFDGWRGVSCQWCTGKVKLSGPSGYIHDGVGNYSIDVKCSWLIDGSSVPNSSIRLHIEEFATECGWDHLYIYDGDSVHSPLLAVYSGLMYKGDYSIRRVPEIVANSGYALIHFYSDVAYNMSGFNISYRLNSCPSRISNVDCSGHGVCIDRVCTCDAYYTGEACDVHICPNNCSYSNGRCQADKHKCECNSKYRGEDCSQVSDLGYWEVVTPRGSLPKGSASHTAVVWRDSLHIIGGESYNTADMIYTYDFTGNVWETNHMDSKTAPTPRYGHSAVIFGDKIYIYGGVKHGGQVCNELWAFDVSAKSWENITVRAEPCNSTSFCGPLKSAGHTATLVRSKKKLERMVVIFGHSPVYGYLSTVQEYHFGTREWSIVKTKGFPVKAGYGHSSAWDPLTEKIYVYGGFISESPASPLLSNKLYSYEPDSQTWTLLSNGPSARYLHTATYLNGLMIVFGGNTHNDTSQSQGAKCYSAEALAYDVICDSWSTLPVPPTLSADLARFGHSAVVFSDSLYIYGGFDGQMLNDILKYTGGNCKSLSSKTHCLNTRPGVKCIWDTKELKCLSVLEIHKEVLINSNFDPDESYYSRCPQEKRSTVAANLLTCNQLNDCISCVHTSLGCGWCPHLNSCTHDNICKQPIPPHATAYNTVRAVTLSTECTVEEGAHCPTYHTCHTCNVQPSCHWKNYDNCIANTTEPQQDSAVSRCAPSCSELTSCLNCTSEECIWCHNEQRCVDKNAYTASFPYGQCREWSTTRNRCPLTPGESACTSHKWCSDCRDAPECGWCDDGTGTGKGICLPGGNNPPPTCPKKHWYFTHCPSCQCNGHSTCANNSSVCIQPCANLTYGEHCETCIPGYYGYPVNGGNCTPCECNNHGNLCVPETGKCYCTTKGIIGDHCERCDTANHYHGDPTNHGSCFYDLTIDYQFTFNLSKKDDRHYTQINFKNGPPKADVDADFSITCSVTAKMNITIKAVNQPEKPLVSNHNCSSFRTRFNKNDHNFGIVENVSLTTFYVYVYDFQPPLWIQISFSQYPKLNLQQFFITGLFFRQ